MNCLFTFALLGICAARHPQANTAHGYDPDVPNPCLQLRDTKLRQDCLNAHPVQIPGRRELTLKEFGDEWDKVTEAIRRLRCPPVEVKPLIEAANEVARNAAKVRGSPTLDTALVAQFNASANELIRKIKLLTVPDRSQTDAIRAIKNFRRKAFPTK